MVRLPLDIVFSIVDNIVSKISERFPVIGEVFSVVVDGFNGHVENLKTIFNGILDFVTGVFTGNWEQAWTGVVSIFGGILARCIEWRSIQV